MKLRFTRSICWSCFLFCLAHDARAETPSAKPRYERAAPPGQTEGNNKPVVIDTERIQGRHEYEAEARSEAELRSRSTISADQAKSRQKTQDTELENGVPAERAANAPEEIPSGPQQNYTPSSTVKRSSASGAPAIESEKRVHQAVPGGVERLPWHAAEERETGW